MVQLRVDVDAARARQEFNSARRSVTQFRGSIQATQAAADHLGDELQVAQARLAQATREFEAAERAADDAADEMRRLQQQIDGLGGPAPQHLVDQLQQAEDALRDAERAEQAARDNMEDLNHEANQLQRNFDDAGDEVRRLTADLALAAAEADRLWRAMDEADRRANRPARRAQRGLLGFRQQASDALRIGSGFGQAIRQSVTDAFNGLPVELRGAIIAAGAATALLFAEVVGSVLNAALLAAVGGGVLAAVVAIAAKSSDAVQKSFSTTFKMIGAEIAGFARDVGTGPLIRTAEIFGDAWRDVAQDVRGLFATAAEWIEPLADGLGGFIRELIPGLQAALKGAGPVLMELASALPAIGRAISDMFRDLTTDDGIQGAVKGMRVLAVTVISVFRTIGWAVGALSEQFNKTSYFIADLLTTLSKIPVVGKMFEHAAATARDFADAGSGAALTLDATGAAARDAEGWMGRQADATSRAAKAAMDLSTQMSALIDRELAASNASIAYEAAIDAISESFKENGRTIDITNAKGRANVQTINAAIAAADQERQANIERGMSVQEANAKYAAHIEQIKAMLKALGLNAAEIDKVVGAWTKVPRDVTTTYRIRVQDSPSAPNIRAIPGLNVARAEGGPVSAGRGYLVGEEGPEWFVPKVSGQILDAMQTAQITGARSAATTAAAAPMSAAAPAPARVEAELVASSSATGAVAELVNTLVKTGAIRLVVRQAGGRVGYVTVN